MALWNTIQNWLVQEAKSNIYMPIPHNHVKDPSYSPDPIISGQHYFRLILTQMSLKHERAWFSTWYPAVHSLTRFTFGDQRVDIPYIADSQSLKGLDPADLDKVIQMNHPLTCLVPFNGGDIDVFAGLFAMKGKDFIESFIHVLSTFSILLTVPPLSKALDIASPLVSSVEQLLGIGDGTLHLGFHQLFNKASGNLRPGYIAIIRGSSDKTTTDQFWVIDDHLRIGPSLTNNKPFTGSAYMLLRIEGTEDRDDWQKFSSIQVPFREAVRSLRRGRSAEARIYLDQAIAAAEDSPDLTRAHSWAAIRELQAQFDQMLTSGYGALEPGIEDLDKVMATALPPASALKLGKPDLEALFA